MLLQYYLQMILLPHEDIYFLECISPISSRTTPQHNANAAIVLITVAKQLNFCLSCPEKPLPKGFVFDPVIICKVYSGFVMSVLKQGLPQCTTAFQALVM